MKRNEYPNDFDHDIVGSCPHDLYYVASIPPDVEGLFMQLNRAGIVLQTPKDFCIRRDDTYGYALLHCVLSGKGYVTVHGKTYTVERGQAFLLGTNEEHCYYSDPQNPMGVIWAEFCGSNSTQLVRHILDMGGYVYGSAMFMDIVSMCTALLYQPIQQGAKISKLIYDMLMRFCSYVEANQAPGISSSRILSYIDENLDHLLTLKEVATVFGYHPTYFSSLFSKMMGVSFSKYVMERKLNRSCYLLEATNWPIDRIAHELGFCDVSHFTKRFKAAKSISPSAYRTNYRHDPTHTHLI